MRAMDARLPFSVAQRTGGLLQSLIYMSGLSGGSWPTTSFATHGFPTADELIPLWHSQIDRLEGVMKNSQYAETAQSMFEDLGAKLEAGFEVTTADFFGRGWGYQFLTGPRGGLNVTYSSIVNLSNFINHQQPLPILQMLTIDPGVEEYYKVPVPNFNNATFYELTPFEFGSWNDPFKSFTPTEWLGTDLSNGSLVNKSSCVRGFDRASLMMGSSGGAFGFWYIEFLSNGTLAPFAKRGFLETSQNGLHRLSKRVTTLPANLIYGIVDAFKKYLNATIPEMMYARWPNPFHGLPSSSPTISDLKTLTVGDGSLSGQAIPLWNQIQPLRSPSFIIIWDDNEEQGPYSWNNGTNLYNTYLATNGR